MFKNTLIYRITDWQAPTLAEINARLATQRFAECGATQQASAGWIEPRGEPHAPLVESIGGQWLLMLCTETKAVPASVVKTQLDARLAKLEADTGRRPRGRHAKELKEGIVHALLPRAFPKRVTTPVWIDPKARLVVVGAAGAKQGDTIASRLVELLGGGIVLSLVQTALAPATAMAGWLQTKQAPPGFSIDRDCELKQPDSGKASVRYARHTLDTDEVAEHIAQGKLPTQLALTWNGRVSFVLSEALALKKITLLDGVLEGSAAKGSAGERFDADVAISTGELGRLVADLLDALGGELQRDPVSETALPIDPSIPAPIDRLAA
jgi:recombination associated protein RdgC